MTGVDHQPRRRWYATCECGYEATDDRDLDEHITQAQENNR